MNGETMSLFSTNNLTEILLKVFGLLMPEAFICVEVADTFILVKLNGFVMQSFPLILRILGWPLNFVMIFVIWSNLYYSRI